ncbi:hypothetical protein FGF66_08520 [Chlorobaculum thiosulfatiphilum]|uniref:Uncharacterized protein n=1 Tax=Chlorobaculum thiosulfatiphilum TaxID=115852 RepID=A0A5C4S5I5_CHLTI|nr:hypothetical protein [Chlorobaculum thiosulfatiphilum]TNJ38488.1 hypothetical protein FGF66_08520 [Chlorobaculum thiosulfatiphilum]
MSQSQIACAFDAGSTTVARVKSTGHGSFTMTMCRTIEGGMDELGGPKASRLAKKLVSMLREWRDEPVALSFSPAGLMPLPAWLPSGSSAEYRDTLCRIEAGYFLDEIERWQWHDMALEPAPSQPAGVDRRMLLFYPLAPARFIENELRKQCRVEWRGAHVEAVARLSAVTGDTLAVLELEERYAALSISTNGKIGYFKYWPVKEASEREYFAITELTSAPLDGAPVKVTGPAASAKVMERISRETSRAIAPLELHPWVSAEKGANKAKSPTATIRAVSAAIMALNGG